MITDILLFISNVLCVQSILLFISGHSFSSQEFTPACHREKFSVHNQWLFETLQFFRSEQAQQWMYLLLSSAPAVLINSYRLGSPFFSFFFPLWLCTHGNKPGNHRKSEVNPDWRKKKHLMDNFRCRVLPFSQFTFHGSFSKSPFRALFLHQVEGLWIYRINRVTWCNAIKKGAV